MCAATESVANRPQRQTSRPRRPGPSLLRRHGDRVEYTPRGDLARSVDALHPGNAKYVGVLVEQVQGFAVVGYLLSAVGPHDGSQRVLVNTGPSFRPAGGEDRWPRHRSTNALAGVVVATIP